jgi:hypothetical protein
MCIGAISVFEVAGLPPVALFFSRHSVHLLLGYAVDQDTRAALGSRPSNIQAERHRLGVLQALGRAD